MNKVQRLFWSWSMGLAALFLISGPGEVLAEKPVERSLLGRGSHCVAYKTRKRMFLVRTVDVVGKSCEVSAQIIPQLGQRYVVEISFPVRSLQSGETERDSDVAKILKADQTPNVIFTSFPLSSQEWMSLEQQGRFTVKGELSIAEERHPLEAEVLVERGEQGLEVDGVVKTQFSTLNIKPPKLFGGLGATVKDELELHFHLLGLKTLGADTIFSR